MVFSSWPTHTFWLDVTEYEVFFFLKASLILFLEIRKLFEHTLGPSCQLQTGPRDREYVRKESFSGSPQGKDSRLVVNWSKPISSGTNKYFTRPWIIQSVKCECGNIYWTCNAMTSKDFNILMSLHRVTLHWMQVFSCSQVSGACAHLTYRAELECTCVNFCDPDEYWGGDNWYEYAE